MLTLPSLPKAAGKLPKLAKLIMVHTAARLPNKTPGELLIADVPFSQKYAVYAPFNSTWEVYVWEWLNASGNQKMHQWETQTTFGLKGGRGSTRVDFLSRILRIAWYLDGAYWHTDNAKQGYDVILRAQVAARGYRVVSWIVSSDKQLEMDLPQFYRDMVYRGRSQ